MTTDVLMFFLGCMPLFGGAIMLLIEFIQCACDENGNTQPEGASELKSADGSKNLNLPVGTTPGR